MYKAVLYKKIDEPEEEMPDANFVFDDYTDENLAFDEYTDGSETATMEEGEESRVEGGGYGKEEEQVSSSNFTPESSQDHDTDYNLPSSASLIDSEEMCHEKGPGKYTTPLKALTAIASRTMMSSRKICLVINAEKEDNGQLNDTTMLAPSKLYKDRCRWGENRIKEREQCITDAGIEVLMFDERKDRTPIIEEVETSVYSQEGQITGVNKLKRVITQVHCPVLVQNTRTKDLILPIYCKTLDVKDGTSDTLAAQIYQEILIEFDSVHKLKVLASDSCNKLSGWNNTTSSTYN